MALFSRSGNTLPELAAAKAEFDALENTNNERIQRMHTYRNEQNRVRDPNLTFQNAELHDYNRRPQNDGQNYKHRIPLPLAKALTVKHAYRIAGQLPDVIVDQRSESPVESDRSDIMEKIVWAIMRASKVESTFSTASWHGSEMGSACFDMYWDFKKQMPIFRAVDPTGIMVVEGVNDPHDFERVYRFWDSPIASVEMMYPEVAGKLTPHNSEGGTDMVRIIQLCDKTKLIRFADCGDNECVELYRFNHNYGFSPYVVIPNIGPYDDVWGWADYEFVRGIVDYMARQFSREADVLKAVAAGAYQETNTGQDPDVIKGVLAKGGVIPIKRDSSVLPIEAADMPTFAESHADRGMQMIKMLGFAPDAAWGLPGSGSGTDRGLQLQPLLEYTAMKQMNWQTGLSRLFGYAYQMIEKSMPTGSKATYSGAKQSASGRRSSFQLILGPGVEPAQAPPDMASSNPSQVLLPRGPKEIFDGDYCVRFNWRVRVDPDDPQYVMSELNKFSSGLQSLETTLENLGVQAPEDEMKRIEAEAQRFPWVNQGLVSLIMAQISGSAQGNGGGAPPDQSGALQGAMQTMQSVGGGGQSGALNTDAGAGALGADAIGVPYGGA